MIEPTTAAAPVEGMSSCPPTIISVYAFATPDVDPSMPGIQVYPGMLVQLQGSAEEVGWIYAEDHCSPNVVALPYTWRLRFQPLGGTPSDVTGDLTGTGTRYPSFTANRGPGTYWADLVSAGVDKTAEVEITVIPLPTSPVLLSATGHITFLRVHDFGSGYGPASDFIDVEAVIQLDTEAGMSFGFQLRNDSNLPARQAMFDLLRDAFNNNWTVTIDYHIVPGEKNGVIIRTWLTKK